LTISGFHLAVMALVTLTLVRLTGDRGWLEPTIVAALVLGYSMIVPPNSPVLRSALMVLLLLASEACGRRYDRLTILFWIGVVVVLVRPLDLWSLGFQLTFGLTALLYAVVPVFESRVVGPQVFGTKPGTVGAGQRLGRVVRGAVAINFSCWLAAAPAILFRTGLASPIAVLAGVIVGPLVVVVLWCGYVALLLGMIEPRIAGWLGVLVRPTARWTTEVAVWLDRVPWGSMRLPPVSWAWAAVTTAVLIVWLRQGWWRRSRGWLITGMLGVWLAIEWSGTGMRASVGTRIDMLGVGDGSCLLVRSGRDAILWDAGSLTAGLGAREIPTALRRLGAWRVPTVVITHPDLDHYGLLPDLIGPLGVENVVLGQRFLDRATGAESGPEAYLLNELSRRGVRVDIAGGGARLALGSREVVFLSPRAGAPYGRDNEHSLVAKVVARGSGDIALADAVLTGDVSSEAVGDLLRSHPTLGARVMELPHHGSADSRAIEWVGRVSPWVVLQSTGPTRVDDPRWAIVRSGREWHCTAVEGAVWAEVGVDGSVRAGGMERGKESGVESPATARDRSR
jgi:competence protein ComEC